MNKKSNFEDVRNLTLGIKLSFKEKALIRIRSVKAGFSTMSDYARELVLNGIIVARPTQAELIESKEAKKLLMKCRLILTRAMGIAGDGSLNDEIVRIIAEINKSVRNGSYPEGK